MPILGVTAIAFLVYFFSLPPTITGEDAGELITAVYSLGIPHPPGYPLWCIVAHPFTWLPWETVAWRVHLSSAVFAAITVGLMAVLIQRMTQSRLAALTGSLALAFSREFWEQAIIAEVYALNALLIIGCLLLLWEWQQSKNQRLLWVFSVVFGLGLANHNTFVLLAPVFAFWVFWVDPQPWVRWRFYLVLAFCAAFVSLTVYLYLPIRSLANPAMDWGNPETLSNWLRHILREQYSFMLTENSRSLGRFFDQLLEMGWAWFWEFTPVTFLLFFIGFVFSVLRNKFNLLLIGVTFSVIVGFILIQNPNDDREWLTVMSVFYIPAYMATAVWIAWGIFQLQYRWGLKMGVPIAFLAVLCPLIWNFEHNNRAKDFWTEDYLKNILGSMAPDAIYIPSMDHNTFGTIYMQEINGIRADITLGRRYGYIETSLAKGMPSERLTEFGPFPPRRHDSEIIAWVLKISDRPVYVDTYMKIPGATCVPAGMVYRLLRAGEVDEWDYWAGYQWHTLSFWDTRGDYTSDLILGQIYSAKARDALTVGGDKTAYQYLELALYATGRDALFLNQAGVTAARGKAYTLAAWYFGEAYKLRPSNEEIAKNWKLIQGKLEQ